jgi:hypothetical protein
MAVSTIKLGSLGLLASAGALWLASFPCLHCVPVIGGLLQLWA